MEVAVIACKRRSAARRRSMDVPSKESDMKRLEPVPTSTRRASSVAKPCPATTRPRDGRSGPSVVPLRSSPLQKLAWIFGIWL